MKEQESCNKMDKRVMPKTLKKITVIRHALSMSFQTAKAKTNK